jgi:hypothetical protein
VDHAGAAEVESPLLNACVTEAATRFAAIHTEVLMQGRRRHTRFSFVKSEGMLTVLRDIVVHTTDAGEFSVVDAEPRTPGESLTIQTMSNGEVATIPVRVIASRPIIQSGAVLHELLLTTSEENR